MFIVHCEKKLQGFKICIQNIDSNLLHFKVLTVVLLETMGAMDALFFFAIMSLLVFTQRIIFFNFISTNTLYAKR